VKGRRDREKTPEPELPVEDEEGSEIGVDGDVERLVRLNKVLADHGIASRRQADRLIAGGKVTVDGEPATELGMKVDPETQRVEIDGVILKPLGARRRYYLLNKPSGVVCTNEPRETRPRAVDFVTDPRKGRIYTVGRLDEASQGLILLTNDGEFANRIMHPRYGVEKTYLVKVRGEIDDDALQKVRQGVHLSDGRTSGARILVERRGRDHSLLTVIIHEGMNRELRRVFAKVGYKVLELRRTRIGPVTDRRLKTGRWRELLSAEIDALLAGKSEMDPPRGAIRKKSPKSFRGRVARPDEASARPPKPGGHQPLRPKQAKREGPKRPSPRGPKRTGPRTSAPFPRSRKR
jgi:23S rRNA pseudouridine2605 synthase